MPKVYIFVTFLLSVVTVFLFIAVVVVLAWWFDIGRTLRRYREHVKIIRTKNEIKARLEKIKKVEKEIKRNIKEVEDAID